MKKYEVFLDFLWSRYKKNTSGCFRAVLNAIILEYLFWFVKGLPQIYADVDDFAD